MTGNWIDIENVASLSRGTWETSQLESSTVFKAMDGEDSKWSFVANKEELGRVIAELEGRSVQVPELFRQELKRLSRTQ